jgi:nucleotide-binding universal stress UspA family protein
MKNILVPCDFSKPAREAFQFAVTLATESKGRIHVLYILDITFLHGNPTLAYSYAFNVSFLKDMETEAETKFQNMWTKYAPLEMPVKFTHVTGSLQSEILKYIPENNIDLVVMGTHGEGGNTWGSNTQRIVRHAQVPVCAIRKKPAVAIRDIVVPIIPDRADKHFCDELKKLQVFFNATIIFLWVNTPQIFKSDTDSIQELQQFATANEFTNYVLHVRSDYNTEEGIYRFTREMHADMIAIGTQGWKGFMHFFNGSIAEDIVNHIDVPVWTCILP